MVACAGLLTAAGLYLWKTDAATVTETPRRTARVARGTLEQTVIATGVVRPAVGAEVKVGSRISGTVARLPVAVGDRVEAGQLLAELDRAALDAAAEEARAELALARPSVALAESVLERRRRLADGGLASGEDLETAARNLAVERARLAAAEARVRSAEIALGYARVTAPIAGVVAEVTTREGETVAAGFSAPTFVTLVDLDRLEVLAYVDETDVGRVFAGQRATFTVDTYPDADFEAVVVAIQPKAELQGNVVNYVARLEYEPAPGRVLRPEMTAHVRLFLAERDGVLTVPRGALRRHDGRRYVVARRGGEWLEQEVTTGWLTDSSAEITGGLAAGETIEMNPQ